MVIYAITHTMSKNEKENDGDESELIDTDGNKDEDDDDDDNDSIDDEQLQEYREMVEQLGTFPVSANGRFFYKKDLI